MGKVSVDNPGLLVESPYSAMISMPVNSFFSTQVNARPQRNDVFKHVCPEASIFFVFGVVSHSLDTSHYRRLLHFHLFQHRYITMFTANLQSCSNIPKISNGLYLPPDQHTLDIHDEPSFPIQALAARLNFRSSLDGHLRLACKRRLLEQQHQPYTTTRVRRETTG